MADGNKSTIVRPGCSLLLRSSWQPGPATCDDEPVFVSVTDFRVTRRRDLLAAARAGRLLGRAWPELPGAVGMWLWTLPLSGRCGSVSVWRDEAALRAFVGWPPHVRIVRRFRGTGTLTSHNEWVPTLDRDEVWRSARRRLVPHGQELS